MFTRDRFMEGMVVRSSDGHKLGKIISTDDQGVVIEKGFFFPKDYRLSFDHVDAIEADNVYLKWGTELVEQHYDKQYGAGAYARETSDASQWREYETGRKSETGLASGLGLAKSNLEAESRQHMSIPLREEELEVTNRGMKETGRVRIVKTVHTEDKHFTVPLRREEVRIERVAGAGGLSEGDAEFADRTIDIPVREEDVEISKKTVVKEHLEVDVDSKTYEKPVSGKVRKEEARIEREETEAEIDVDRELGEKKVG